MDHNSDQSPLFEKNVNNEQTSDYSQIFIIEAGSGDNAKRYLVHERIATRRSSFFKAALTGNWKEANERLVKLPEDKPDVVERYIDLLYGGKFSLVKIGRRHSRQVIRINFLNLAELYIFADKVQDAEIRSKSMQEFIDYANEGSNDRQYSPDMSVVRAIYKKSPKECALRRFVVAVLAHRHKKHRLSLTPAPREFLHDMIDELSIHSKSRRCPCKDREKYLNER